MTDTFHFSILLIGSKPTVNDEVVATPTSSSATKQVQRKRKLENADDSFATSAKTPSVETSSKDKVKTPKTQLQKTPAKGPAPVKTPIQTSAKGKIKTPASSVSKTALHTPTQTSATSKTPATVKTPASAKSSAKVKVQSRSEGTLTPNIQTTVQAPSKSPAKTPLKV